MLERVERPPSEIRLPAPMGPVIDVEGSAAGVPLSHYLWVLKRHLWKIAAFVTAVVLATLVVTSNMTPMYEATATVDIDRQTPQGVIGQESTRSTFNDSDQFLATQVRLIQSDSVLRPVSQKYDLAAKERGGKPVQASRKDAPVRLKNLKVARHPNTYLLLISYRSPDPQLAADAANGVAQSYLEHTYNLRYRSSASLSRFMERQLEELRSKMERSSSALAAFEKELNVISPEEKTSILSARLLQLNTEYTAAQGDRVRREAALASIKKGALETAEARGSGEMLRRLVEHQNEARERFVEVQSHFGKNHPEYRKAADRVAEIERQLAGARETLGRQLSTDYDEAVHREQMLRKAVAETKAEFDRLNSRSFEYQSLKRDAEADKKLYEELVRKIKEAGINASFQNSSIRIADMARPGELPVSPNLKLNLIVAFLVSLLIAVIATIASEALDNTVRDPDHASRMLGAEVIGSLPVVKTWRGRLGLAETKTEAFSTDGGETENLASGYHESIRTLRNSILLSDLGQRPRSLLVTSASPGEGKSTIAAHLALSHAEQGLKTLLIDGDLRRPSVHKRFNLPTKLGLSEVLVGRLPWREALVRVDRTPNLDILPAGTVTRRADDLVGRAMEELIEEVLNDYDLVVLDAPPLLGFAEPLQMATTVDGVLVVTRAGVTNRRQVASVLSTLKRLRANVTGVVLNQVHKNMSDSYTYYGNYGKYYAEQTAS